MDSTVHHNTYNGKTDVIGFNWLRYCGCTKLENFHIFSFIKITIFRILHINNQFRSNCNIQKLYLTVLKISIL